MFLTLIFMRPLTIRNLGQILIREGVVLYTPQSLMVLLIIKGGTVNYAIV